MMKKVIYNGEGAVFGRVASAIAKDLLKGYRVDLINCEKIIVSGDKNLFVKKVLAKRKMGSGGSMKGPKYIRVADRLVKRMIRGMLPWDRTKGREAFKRLKCHSGGGGLGEDSLKNAIKLNHRKPKEYSTVGDIVRSLR